MLVTMVTVDLCHGDPRCLSWQVEVVVVVVVVDVDVVVVVVVVVTVSVERRDRRERNFSSWSVARGVR